ncbi:putative phosphatidylglycerol/phosphatidylinositol transfer protein [Hibiscus syriacus]|uniref:Phosphatidylglycerol/phosphatidylinositol transfer protein n=1 Tax=Hibiscus syriacus TaxID=106335 RepID=A0A6A2X6E7_HIBSY|nr:putative phosphatidylglycerol/phosphatidylinositol transfer protein [Hibiscus syriacus]
MRRQGQYADSGGNAYASAQMQHAPAQRMEVKPGQFQGQLEAFTPERDQPYQTPKSDGQWSLVEPVAGQVMLPWSVGQGTDGSRMYFQGQRPDPNLSLEKQNADIRSRPHDENMEVGYEQNVLPPTLEGLEKKFHDDMMKLAKEQSEAEDAENTRHREKINAINTQYQEQLTALRARHANRRDELLRKESLARQQQYQQAMMDYYPHTGNNPHGYGSIAGPAAVGDAYRGYNTDNFDSYGERSRFHGGARDQGFEPRGSYQGGRAYDTGSRYN